MKKVFLVAMFLVSCSGKSLPQGVRELALQHSLPQADQIEVLEILWLGCPHCQEFHKDWVALKKQFGSEVNFRQIPATFDGWKFDARVYVTLEELGLSSDGVLASYYEVRQGPDKQKFATDVQAISGWLQQRYGILQEDFQNMFDSSLVDDKLAGIREMLRKYPMITGVPAVLMSVPERSKSYLVQYSGAEETRNKLSNLIREFLPR